MFHIQLAVKVNLPLGSGKAGSATIKFAMFQSIRRMLQWNPHVEELVTLKEREESTLRQGFESISGCGICIRLSVALPATNRHRRRN